MNKNSRFYPPYYPAVDALNNTLAIHHDEKHIYAKFHPNFVATIVDRSHARRMRKKTGCNLIITGDEVYMNLYWLKYSQEHGLRTFDSFLPITGMAVIRNKEVIWYEIPGIPDGLAERKVLIEKLPPITKNKILKGIVQFGDISNR